MRGIPELEPGFAAFFPGLPKSPVLGFLAGHDGTNSAYMISITCSLQLLVPDRMRGRVMGFFGVIWNILPLGGMQVGILASLITAPYAVAFRGVAVAGFASGSAA